MFTQDDINKYKQFKHVIDQGKFELKGDSAIKVALLFDWFNKLEEKIKIKKIKKPIVKEIK